MDKKRGYILLGILVALVPLLAIAAVKWFESDTGCLADGAVNQAEPFACLFVAMVYWEPTFFNLFLIDWFIPLGGAIAAVGFTGLAGKPSKLILTGIIVGLIPVIGQFFAPDAYITRIFIFGTLFCLPLGGIFVLSGIEKYARSLGIGRRHSHIRRA